MANSHHQRSRGFTLVELLVVIFIIGVLVALLVPAIQSARESARRVQCKNQLRQLALAALNHHEAQGHFPTGGWGSLWVGDADRGFGQLQPGGWTFNLLPFLEESNLHELAADGRPAQITEAQREGAKRLIESALPILYCPSRRVPAAHPSPGLTPMNAAPADFAGRLDYAISCGDGFINAQGSGPDSIDGYHEHLWAFTPIGDSIEHDLRGLRSSPLTGQGGFSGVSFERSEVAQRHVTDGFSTTYLIGEKYLRSTHYETGEGAGNWLSWCAGFFNDGYRTGYLAPRQDDPIYDSSIPFGSAHSSGFHMAYCDGSVRVISYDIELGVHRAGANRKDGTAHGVGESNEVWPRF